MCIICAPGAWGRAVGKPARRFVATAVGVASPTVADVILRGAILTMDDAVPRAEAVAVGDGRILAVGTMDSVAPWRGRRTRIVALDGRALLPGFIDAHWRAPDASIAEALAIAAAGGFTRLRAAAADDAPPPRMDEAALRAITIEAARLCGIDDVAGSIAVGKSADFAIVAHGPDHAPLKIVATWLEGREIFRA